MTQLPDKPSALIRLALQDLERVEAQPDIYMVDMYSWHEPSSSQCHVCLAGAVMAGTLGADPGTRLVPPSFGKEGRKLAALNGLRGGYIREALVVDLRIAQLPDGVEPYMSVPHYEWDPTAFRTAMLAMADHLEEHGL